MLAGAAIAAWGYGVSEWNRETRLHEEIGRAMDSPGGPDYAAAVVALRRAERRPGQKDAQVASFTLRALADPAAGRRPPGTVDGALTMLERAAVRDPRRDGALIQDTMRHGVRAPREGAVLLAPRPDVADCWAAARADDVRPARCVELRRGG